MSPPKLKTSPLPKAFSPCASSSLSSAHFLEAFLLVTPYNLASILNLEKLS